MVEKREVVSSAPMCYLISISFILALHLFGIAQLLLSLTIARTMTKQDHWLWLPSLLLFQFLI